MQHVVEIHYRVLLAFFCGRSPSWVPVPTPIQVTAKTDPEVRKITFVHFSSSKNTPRLWLRSTSASRIPPVFSAAFTLFHSLYFILQQKIMDSSRRSVSPGKQLWRRRSAFRLGSEGKKTFSRFSFWCSVPSSQGRMIYGPSAWRPEPL